GRETSPHFLWQFARFDGALFLDELPTSGEARLEVLPSELESDLETALAALGLSLEAHHPCTRIGPLNRVDHRVGKVDSPDPSSLVRRGLPLACAGGGNVADGDVDLLSEQLRAGCDAAERPDAPAPLEAQAERVDGSAGSVLVDQAQVLVREH